MDGNQVLLLLLCLGTKHLIVDFPLQASPYQYTNKGTYGHPGGLLHSGLHVLGTFIALFAFAPIQVVMWLSILDGVVHYHIDWAKMNLNKKMGWGPTTHEQFWTLLGIDQYLHLLTYLGIVWILL